MPSLIIPSARLAVNLIRAFNLQNVVAPPSNNNPYDGNIDQTLTQDKELYKSQLGTPVLANLTFKGLTYTDNNGRKVTLDDLVFDLVLITISQGKKIITTEIQGSDGTVKEYIGMDDYQIEINGLINGPNGHYPIDEVNDLQQFNKAPVAIEVVSSYFHNLDIYNIVIKDFKYGQDVGMYSQQGFTITAISESPTEIIFQ